MMPDLRLLLRARFGRTDIHAPIHLVCVGVDDFRLLAFARQRFGDGNAQPGFAGCGWTDNGYDLTLQGRIGIPCFACCFRSLSVERHRSARLQIGIGDEIVAPRMGDGGGHEIAYLRHRLAFGHTDMHEHAGFLAAGDTVGVGVLLAEFAGDHHFDITAFEGFEIFFGDSFLQCHESFEPVLGHVVRHLLHFGGRSAWARRIDEGERGRESRLFHHAQGFLEVLFGFTRGSRR